MPEGHTLHRLAAAYRQVFGGESVRVSSPQGPFAQAALRLDGRPLTGTEAHGKHLFLGFGGTADPASTDWVHIHLGLYGKVRFGEGPAPEPVGQIRLRISTADDTAHADLRGPTTCALISDPEKQEVHRRLGPDPLRDDSVPEQAWQRVSRSGTTVAALLMDQKVLSGVGNIYRAEVLFRQGIDPRLPGRALTREQWDAVWKDLTLLMADGVRDGWIDTVRPEHTPQAMGRPAREDAHGGEVYVYRRAGLPCLVCATPVSAGTHAGRNLFWCPACQPATPIGSLQYRP
ncbi:MULTISPECIES: Fpg/Nei family DNA glycosylase [Streptacidiphilus]|uniref:DNA-(apurinic or apyrimidinic site) lyase n=1 Tax=Streptacidiphilus cavernicola TaxID=3342716 RepID=A0ABV6UEV8_9ACTN|nr:DNA-formamidopyrimidine glycosylase family protein [Streptacidiphilus jeojiense]